MVFSAQIVVNLHVADVRSRSITLHYFLYNWDIHSASILLPLHLNFNNLMLTKKNVFWATFSKPGKSNILFKSLYKCPCKISYCFGEFPRTAYRCKHFTSLL